MQIRHHCYIMNLLGLNHIWRKAQLSSTSQARSDYYQTCIIKKSIKQYLSDNMKQTKRYKKQTSRDIKQQVKSRVSGIDQF